MSFGLELGFNTRCIFRIIYLLHYAGCKRHAARSFLSHNQRASALRSNFNYNGLARARAHGPDSENPGESVPNISAIVYRSRESREGFVVRDPYIHVPWRGMRLACLTHLLHTRRTHNNTRGRTPPTPRGDAFDLTRYIERSDVFEPTAPVTGLAFYNVSNVVNRKYDSRYFRRKIDLHIQLAAGPRA